MRANCQPGCGILDAVLIKVLRTHLRPYRRWLATSLALQLVSTLAALYLPSLNADIIDRGIARGDTGYIVRTGGWMLLISVVQLGRRGRGGVVRLARRDVVRT